MKQFKVLFSIATIFCLLYSCKHNETSINIQNGSIDPDSLPVVKHDSIYQKVGIKMTKRGGVYELPCLVNGVKMNFIFDTGASNVCLSTTEALFLYKNGYLDDTDFIGESYSRIADGSIVENMEIMLKSISIGGVEVNNVKAIVVQSLDAPLLLGQTAIQKFGRIEFLGDSLFITIKKEPQTTDADLLSYNQDIKPSPQKETKKILLFNRKKKKVDQILIEAIDVMNKDMPELAIQTCIKAIHISPKDWRAHAILGLMYEKVGKGDKYHYEIADHLNKYISLNKEKETLDFYNISLKWPDVVSQLAWDYTQSGKTKEAITTAQEVLLYDPNNVGALNTISHAYTIDNDYTNAEKWALKLKEVSEEKGTFRLAYIYSKQGRILESINMYTKYLELNPDNSSAIGNLALQYSKYFKDEEWWSGDKYYPPVKDKDYYWETVRLHIKAARMGNTNSQQWLKKRNLEW